MLTLSRPKSLITDNPNRTEVPWGENILHLTPSYYSVTIPEGLEDGEYLLRHEVRFGPACSHILVVDMFNRFLVSMSRVKGWVLSSTREFNFIRDIEPSI
jgi:hypothetical protein